MSNSQWTSFFYGIIIIILCAFLATCVGGKGLRDGVYTARSAEDDKGAFGEITVTIASGKVADCVYVTRQKDGSIKDADYGKVNSAVSNPDYYAKAQLAVRAMSTYARAFAESGSLREVDAVSGATVSWNQFMEAAEAALEAAGR